MTKWLGVSFSSRENQVFWVSANSFFSNEGVLKRDSVTNQCLRAFLDFESVTLAVKKDKTTTGLLWPEAADRILNIEPPGIGFPLGESLRIVAAKVGKLAGQERICGKR